MFISIPSSTPATATCTVTLPSTPPHLSLEKLATKIANADPSFLVVFEHDLAGIGCENHDSDLQLRSASHGDVLLS